jgi:hypothetical protein
MCRPMAEQRSTQPPKRLTKRYTMQPGIAMNSPTASPSADTSALGGENVPTKWQSKGRRSRRSG